VDKVAWNELVTGEIAEQLEDPLSYSFFKCTETVMSIVRLRRPGEPVTFFFDEGTKPRLGDFANYIELRKDQYPEIERILFCPVRKVIPLHPYEVQRLRATSACVNLAEVRLILSLDLRGSRIDHADDGLRGRGIGSSNFRLPAHGWRRSTSAKVAYGS
jgi:hypothetical protein